MISFGFSCALVFLFRGAESFELGGLPRFRRAPDDSFDVTLFCQTGTSTLAGAFAAGICDFVTFIASLNASGI